LVTDETKGEHADELKYQEQGCVLAKALEVLRHTKLTLT